jgi:Tol biopolymer transport system component
VLLAAPFDAKNKRAGDPSIVRDDLRSSFLYGAQYALSDTGTLLYASGGATDEGKLVKVDRDGNAQDLGVSPGIFQSVAMAPIGNRIAVSMLEGGKMHMYFIDLGRTDVLNPLTSDGTINTNPVWNPQGDKIAFYSDREEASNLWIQAADLRSKANKLLDVGRYCLAHDWSSNGSLIFEGLGAESNYLLKVLAMDGKRQSSVLFDYHRDVRWGCLSPDNRRLLYAADKSGVMQIFVQPWPVTPSGEVQISNQESCFDPRWSRDGKEIFYRTGDQCMSVTVPDSLEGWNPKPKPMFRKYYLNAAGRSWDVMDAQHFIMIQPTHPDPPKTELHFIKNWFEELKRGVPIK